MPLVVLGINHTTAPVEMRERLSIGERELPDALRAFCRVPVVVEGALLSTCNRTEAYAVVSPDADAPEDAFADFLAARHGLSRREFDGHLYCYREGAAAGHLLSVAAGLDSMILGEPDIQRQVRQALDAAQTAKSVGPLLNKLFQDALTVGKRARTETGIARGAFSVGAAAVELATQIFGETLAGNTVLVLGAGKMSEVTARHLQARGAPAVLVANRTYEKAQILATQFGGTARKFDDLPELLTRADIVVCSTAAPHPIVTQAVVKDALRRRHHRPLFLIDIAVPRDVESNVDDLDNVFLYNIDHLQQVVAAHRDARTTEAARAQEIVNAGVESYLAWRRTLEATPLIVAFRQKMDALRLESLSRLRVKLPGLPDAQWRVIDAEFQALTARIAHPAIVAIKESADADAGKSALETLRKALGLEDAPPAPKFGGAGGEDGLGQPSFSLAPPNLGAGGASQKATEP